MLEVATHKRTHLLHKLSDSIFSHHGCLIWPLVEKTHRFLNDNHCIHGLSWPQVDLTLQTSYLDTASEDSDLLFKLVDAQFTFEWSVEHVHFSSNIVDCALQVEDWALAWLHLLHKILRAALIFSAHLHKFSCRIADIAVLFQFRKHALNSAVELLLH